MSTKFLILQAEALQMEVDQLKEKLEEVSLDLQIMKEEVSQAGTEGGATSYQVKQLEQQNERLKEALVKYVFIFFCCDKQVGSSQ